MTSAVVGLWLIAGAVFLIADRSSDIPFVALWVAAGLVLLGMGLVASGLRGRRSGVLGFFACVGLVVGLPIAGWYSLPVHDGTWTGHTVDETVSVTSPRLAERGFSYRFGDARIDLSSLDLATATPSDPVRVPIRMGAGALRITVPADAAVRADVNVGVGSVAWRVDSDRSSSGFGRDLIFNSGEVDAEHGPVLILTVDVGAGDLTIEEE